MPFLVEPMFPEQTISRISLMFAFTVWTFEQIRTEFAFLGFEPREISFLIGFTVPHKLAVVDSLVRAIALDTLCPLNSAHTWCMTLFPTVFTLWYSRVHVNITNCGNKTSNVEPSTDEALCFSATLSVPDINPYNGHIGFGGHLDYS